MDRIERRTKEIDRHVKRITALTGRSYAEALAMLQIALSMSQVKELKEIAKRLDEFHPNE